MDDMRSQQMNKNKSAKRNRGSRKRNRGFGRFIFLAVLIVLVVVGGITAFKVLSGDGYDDEKSSLVQLVIK